MSRKSRFGLRRLLIGALALAVFPALAQTGAGEARGLIVDEQGNPLPGVKIVFSNTHHELAVYEGKTNKKGRFYVSGLVYDQNNPDWNVRVELEGYEPAKIDVQTRNNVAVMDKFEKEIGPGAKIPQIRIPGFGQVTFDVTMVPQRTLAAAETVAVQVLDAEPSGGQAAPTATDPWDAAKQAMSNGDFAGAVSLLTKAIEKQPDDVERVTALARVHYRLEEYGPAARQAVRATQMAPDSLEAQMVLYSVNVATSNLAGAAVALDRAAEIAPDDLRVLKQQVYVAEQQGDTDKVLATYERIVELDPQNGDAWAALGGMYADAGREAESRAAFEKVAEIQPDEAYQVFYNIGALIMNSGNASPGDTKRAVDAFRKAIEINPDYRAAYPQLAYAQIGLGDFGGARETLQAYLDRHPKAPDATDMRALLRELPQ